MTSPNITIKPKANSSSSGVRKNKQLSLLRHLKKIEDSKLMVDELKKLIQTDKLKNFQLDPVQLKAILSLFSEHHLFIALQLLVEHFAAITLNIKELKSIQFKPTQLISILSLFHTLNRSLAFETLLMSFTNDESTTLKNFELKAAQLKAILFLFATSDRFGALNRLKNHFNVKVHLTANDIKELEACLSRDHAFTKLSAFSQKKVWNDFYPKQEKLANDTLIQNKDKSNTKLKNSKLPVFVNQFPKNSKQIKSSEPISLDSIESKKIRFRFEYFKNYIKAHNHQVVVFKNIKEFERFIKVFPPQDAIEFLNLPYIKSQIKDLQQRNLQFSKEAYRGLLNYLKNDSVKKLLRPVSPYKETKFLNFDTGKSVIAQQEKISYESDSESLWEKIEEQLTKNSSQNFYYFLKKEIDSNPLIFIDNLDKLRAMLIGLPCEKRFEIFSLPKIQEILNKFGAKELVQLYEFFPPEHSVQFLNSPAVISRLTAFSFSNDERKDIISYFPDATMRSLVKTRLNTVPRALFFKNPYYDSNQDSRLSSSEDEGYRSGNVSPQI